MDKSGTIDTISFILAVLKQQRESLEQQIAVLSDVEVKIKKMDKITDNVNLILDEILDSSSLKSKK